MATAKASPSGRSEVHDATLAEVSATIERSPLSEGEVGNVITRMLETSSLVKGRSLPEAYGILAGILGMDAGDVQRCHELAVDAEGAGEETPPQRLPSG